MRIAVAAMLIAVGTASATPPPLGILEGTLKAPVQRGAELADDVSSSSASDQPTYTLALRKDGKEVAHVETDKQGKYRIALPPGEYVLDLKEVRKRRRVAGSLPRHVTVLVDKTSRVDIELPADPSVM